MPPVFASELAHHTTGDQPSFAGDPTAFVEPVFPGAWVPQVYTEEEAGAFLEHVQAYEADPADLVEPVFFDGWWRDGGIPFSGGLGDANIPTQSHMIAEEDFSAPEFSTFGWERPSEHHPVAGIPPLHFAPHTIAEEDVPAAPAFSTFGWERPSEFQLSKSLQNRVHEHAETDYEAIISTPDLVNFVGWNPHYLIPRVPDPVYYTLQDWVFVADPDSLLALGKVNLSLRDRSLSWTLDARDTALGLRERDSSWTLEPRDDA